MVLTVLVPIKVKVVAITVGAAEDIAVVAVTISPSSSHNSIMVTEALFLDDYDGHQGEVQELHMIKLKWIMIINLKNSL